MDSDAESLTLTVTELDSENKDLPAREILRNQMA